MADNRYAFFDVDHTLIAGSTGKHLAFRCVKEGLLPFRNLLRIPLLYFHYRTGQLRPSILEELLKQLRGIPIQRIRDLAAEIFDSRIRSIIFVRAVEQIEEERRKGRIVALATSAPESIVAPLAEYLGITEIVATRFEVRDEKLTGAFDGIPAFGRGKLERVCSFAESRSTDLRRCSFYSDSHYDLPLLSMVEEAVAVNPDRVLSGEALRRGWSILNYKKVLGKSED